jgi:hypothetical protein
MLDKAKLPPDTWVRMVWLPADDSDRSERPIVLITDRTRILIFGIPAVAALLVAVVLMLARAPAWATFLFLLVSLGAGLYGSRGKNGYYEVGADGGLGHFFGRRAPAGIRAMRRSRP